MRYDYNGDLEFSRPLTEEEMDEVIGIICFAYNHVCPNRNNDCLSIDAPEYGSHGYEIGQVSEWCKQHNVTLTKDSCIRYTGSYDGAFFQNEEGKMVDHDLEEYFFWKASDQKLIDELKRRGIWQKQRHLIDIGAEYIRNDLAAAEPDYVKDVLDSIGADDDDLRELGLDDLITENTEEGE